MSKANTSREKTHLGLSAMFQSTTAAFEPCINSLSQLFVLAVASTMKELETCNCLLCPPQAQFGENSDEQGKKIFKPLASFCVLEEAVRLIVSSQCHLLTLYELNCPSLSA